VNFFEEFRRVVTGWASDCLVQVIDKFRAPGSLSKPGAAAVNHNAHNPWLQRTLIVPAIKAAEDAQENLLRYILGILAMVQ
jgi:hypothetical protein